MNLIVFEKNNIIFALLVIITMCLNLIKDPNIQHKEP